MEPTLKIEEVVWSALITPSFVDLHKPHFQQFSLESLIVDAFHIDRPLKAHHVLYKGRERPFAGVFGVDVANLKHGLTPPSLAVHEDIDMRRSHIEVSVCSYKCRWNLEAFLEG